MEILKRLSLDVKPIINAAGVVSTYGGASMSQEVVEAMSQATQVTVRIDELQAAASKFIAKITGAEAGYVTCGCAASLMLGTAACLTGYDVDRINRLPDTSDMPNEILIANSQRCGYDHPMRAAGAKVIYVGVPSGVLAPGQIYDPLIEDYEVAITDRTVAIAYFDYGGGIPPLEEIVSVGKKYNLPIILDAANSVPPVENLRNFISMGVDLVAVSGGKGIRGPQQSGLLFGKHDLIAAAALNCFIPDFSGGYASYDKWSPPPSLIAKEKLRGVPHHPVGRGCKVSKEAIIGLLTALQVLTNEDRYSKEVKRLRLLLEPIAQRLQGVHGVNIEIADKATGGLPTIVISINRLELGQSMDQISQRLKEGDPPIYVFAPRRFGDKCIVSALGLNKKDANIVADRLHAVITSK
jgi:L-seryl-tRNA(Ser) seleniumtransferase